MKVIGIATQQPNGSLQATTESQLVAKTLQQYHPTEVGQMGILARQTQCLQAFGHGCMEKMTGF